MVLLKVHIFSIWVPSFLLPSQLSSETHHAFRSVPHGMGPGKLSTHSTSSRALHDLERLRLSFISRLLQRSWLVRWRAWFRANKLLQDRARRLPPPGGGGCGAGRIPAEPRAAGGGGAASLCAGTLTSPPRPRLRGQGGWLLPSGRTRCTLFALKEAQGRVLLDQTRIVLRASPSPARVEVGNRTGDPGVRACASWLSPLPGTASQPQRPQPRRISSLLCAFTPSSVARAPSTRISIAHTSASQTHP